MNPLCIGARLNSKIVQFFCFKKGKINYFGTFFSNSTVLTLNKEANRIRIYQCNIFPSLAHMCYDLILIIGLSQGPKE